MAKKKTRKKKGFTISAAVVGGMVPLAMDVKRGFDAQGFMEGALPNLARGLTGYDTRTKKWNWFFLRTGLMPILAGTLVHKLAGKFGLNRMIANAGIPFVRI